MINLLLTIFTIIISFILIINLYHFLLYCFPWIISDHEEIIFNKTNALYFIYNFSIPKLLNGVNSTYRNILESTLYEINSNFSPKYEDQDSDLMFEITFNVINKNMDIIPINKPITYYIKPYVTNIDIDDYFKNIDWLNSKNIYYNPNLVLIKINVLKTI